MASDSGAVLSLVFWYLMASHIGAEVAVYMQDASEYFQNPEPNGTCCAVLEI
ncbi:hypothetical protein N431DRAFT_46205 [Stipitochalara longipes BDJ]|nr:hypothetical protein N431DRAFT_46205 [Stipitochalara longipes BDJ]